MKLLHTSDWHLGMSAGTKSMEEDQRFFLHQLYNIIEDEQIDAVLCAGDIYDSSVSNAEAIAVYNDATTEICAKRKVPFLVIAGNHDGAARLASCRELLKEAGLFVTGRLVRDVEPVSVGNADIYLVPFFHKEEVIALFPEYKKEITSQEKAMQVVCNHIRENWNPRKRHILMTHALIVNAELSESDRSARVGLATAVSKDVFEGFDYVALGHIHKPQVISEHVRYSGSPVKYSFGNEEKQEKCVIVIDTDTMEQKAVPLKQLHDRRTITGTYEEIVAMEDLENAYLRLKVTDRYAGLDLLADMQTRFPYLLELYGKSLDENGDLSAMSVEELQTMDELDIMKKFCAETFSYEPSEEQVALFEEVLAWSEKEDDVS
ncbi:MAG: exonuclease SbcCD subunit D [bacterium]|nr:exonuclease SbcCD subunit D [bacterium]